MHMWQRDSQKLTKEHSLSICSFLERGGGMFLSIIFLKQVEGAGETAQRLRALKALAAPAEALCLVPSTHMLVYNHL